LLNCINCNLVPHGTRNHPDEVLLTADLASADSGLQLDLAIALSGGSSVGPAPRASSARPKMRWNVGWRNRRQFYQHSRQPHIGL